MKPLFYFAVFIFIINAANAQYSNHATIDFIKCHENHEEEALFYYENNWKLFRQEALKQKVISGYEMHKTKTDSLGFFKIILITKYADSTSYNKAEENFAPIMKSMRPNGPKLLNAMKPREFLENILSEKTVIWTSN